MKIIPFIVGAALAASGTSALAQGILASGFISGSPSGSDFNYSLTVEDGSGATSPIGSFWYAWTPGNFYLPSTPLSASVPTGWTANIESTSIQFIASSAGFDVQPGGSLSGFGFSSTSAPSAVEGNVVGGPNNGVPVGTTVAYAQALFSSPSDQFAFTPAAVPEPSSLVLMAVGALGVWQRRRK